MVACLALALHGCTSDSGPGSPSRRARQFYTALNTQDFDRAASMLADDEAKALLLARFGSVKAWGDRVTKNGIVSQLHAVETSVEAQVARVEVSIMFHDGTRRHDNIRLVHQTPGWTIDAASVPGNEDTHGS